jgi:hypothetical protein
MKEIVMSDKPKCYKCIHRKNVPGSAHSACGHPDIGIEFKLQIRAAPNEERPLGIIGCKHGIKKGWFCWPFNFDPVWLIKCKGFFTSEQIPQNDNKDLSKDYKK